MKPAGNPTVLTSMQSFFNDLFNLLKKKWATQGGGPLHRGIHIGIVSCEKSTVDIGIASHLGIRVNEYTAGELIVSRIYGGGNAQEMEKGMIALCKDPSYDVFFALDITASYMLSKANFDYNLEKTIIFSCIRDPQKEGIITVEQDKRSRTTGLLEFPHNYRMFIDILQLAYPGQIKRALVLFTPWLTKKHSYEVKELVDALHERGVIPSPVELCPDKIKDHFIEYLVHAIDAADIIILPRDKMVERALPFIVKLAEVRGKLVCASNSEFFENGVLCTFGMHGSVMGDQLSSFSRPLIIDRLSSSLVAPVVMQDKSEFYLHQSMVDIRLKGKYKYNEAAYKEINKLCRVGAIF